MWSRDPVLTSYWQAPLQAVADQFQLQVRGSAGEHSEAVGGLYDVSNRERMGLTEFQVTTQLLIFYNVLNTKILNILLQAVKKMYDGVKQLIKMESEL